MSENSGTNDVARVEGDFAEVEARLAIVGVEDQGQSGELLERLVDLLLSSAGGLDAFDTDGLVVSRRVDLTDGYLAVGHVWLLPHGREPVRIHLAFSPDGTALRSGEVLFGLSLNRLSTSTSRRPTDPLPRNGMSARPPVPRAVMPCRARWTMA